MYYFLSYFTNESTQWLKTDTRKEGYIPRTFIALLSELTSQREALIQEQQSSKQFLFNYLQFMRETFQRITSTFDGRYLSLDITACSLPIFLDPPTHVQVLKISPTGKFSIDKFYN